MNYVTIAMLCAHAGKHRTSVLRALKSAGVEVAKKPGVRGIRLTEKEANRFLAMQWPEVGPMPVRLIKTAVPQT